MPHQVGRLERGSRGAFHRVGGGEIIGHRHDVVYRAESGSFEPQQIGRQDLNAASTDMCFLCSRRSMLSAISGLFDSQ